MEVAMSKKCTSLWREAHFQVKKVQNTPCSGVEMSKKRTPLWHDDDNDDDNDDDDDNDLRPP